MSKIYNEVVIDMNPESPDFEQVLHEDSFEYNGEMALCHMIQSLGGTPKHHTHPTKEEEARAKEKRLSGVNPKWGDKAQDFFNSLDLSDKSREDVYNLYNDWYKENEDNLDSRSSEKKNKRQIYAALQGSDFGEYTKGYDDVEEGEIMYDKSGEGAKELMFQDGEWVETGNKALEWWKTKGKVVDEAGLQKSQDVAKSAFEERREESGDPHEGKFMIVPSGTYEEKYKKEAFGETEIRSRNVKGADRYEYRNGEWVKTNTKPLKYSLYEKKAGQDGLKDARGAEYNVFSKDTEFTSEALASGDFDLSDPLFFDPLASKANKAGDPTGGEDIDGDGTPDPQPAPGSDWGAESFGKDDFIDSVTGKQLGVDQIIENLAGKGVIKPGIKGDDYNQLKNNIMKNAPRFADFAPSEEQMEFAQADFKKDLGAIQDQAASPEVAAMSRAEAGGQGSAMRQKRKQEKNVAKKFEQAQTAYQRDVYNLNKNATDKYESELATYWDTVPEHLTKSALGGYIYRDGSGISTDNKNSTKTFLDILTELPDSGGV